MRTLPLLPILFAFSAACADVTLPPLISDNMLLQQPQATVWGKANPGEQVTVTLGKSVAKATADKDGHWRATLDGLKPGVAGTMIVAGKNTIALQNVAVGDVWVCSGQSNMEMTITRGPWCGNGPVLNFKQEIATANFPKIRMFIVPRKSSETPLEEVAGKWEICTPENIPHWSAVAYFFARQLHQDTALPIGLINASWGGTNAHAWTPTEVLQGDPDFKTTYYDKRQAELANYPALQEKFEKETLPTWQSAFDAAKAAGKPAPKKPEPPMGPGMGRTASALYNGMIAGLTKYPIKGAIWYQGESDSWEGPRYRRLLPAIITSWRKAWGQGEFPFYIVQLANFRAMRPEPADSHWAEFREVQRQIALTVPNSGLAVTLDVGDAKDVHFANKQEVGRRLALVAEAKTYGKAIICSGPDFDTARFEGENVKIAFKPGTTFGLTTKDGAPIKGFALAGEDKKFVWAEAKIIPGEEPVIVLNAPQIAKPVAVRYGWAKNPEVNLVNQAGLPAVPFRTDEWPQVEPPEITPTSTPGATPAASK